ncbi:MAG: polysaccharide biosynthesis tyrosine autokinase [Ignavibacteriaceae bacterium]|nr:polysaccharide biosynthesis tyrosine autokinase [Ignavibacteriaceae bacterium]
MEIPVNNETQVNTFKDYLIIVRNNLLPIILITVVSTIFAVLYAVNAIDIYNSYSSLRISKEGGNILDPSALFGGGSSFGEDRFISNEIELMKSHMLRLRVAEALIDTFKKVNDPEAFSLIVTDGEKEGDPLKLKSPDAIAAMLNGVVTIEQKRGLDFVTISANSPSPYEAALISNTYTRIYREINLELNRDQLSLVKKFLNGQREEKMNELKSAEEDLKTYQEIGGIVALDAQASQLISSLANFESQKRMNDIDLKSTQQTLKTYKDELAKIDPNLSAYIENFQSEAYLKSLQTEIAKLELNRDVAVSTIPESPAKAAAVKDYDYKIAELRKKLEVAIEKFKMSLFAGTPAEVRELTQKIIEQEIKLQGLQISAIEIAAVIRNLEIKFNQLPTSSIELARLTRNREALEKLYILVEQRYQEALINEQSQPGNVTIIDSARIPGFPSKPNRLLIIFAGFIIGMVFAVAFALVRNYLDNTIKTPEDIQKYNLPVLTWIPHIEGLDSSKDIKASEFIVYHRPDSIPSEAFRALRTRFQFAIPDSDVSMKTILITSSAPAEGKTLICNNLAASFAQLGKRVVVIDCDLRKPRIHSFYSVNRYPGLVDHLFGIVPFEEVLRPSEMKDLYFITAGTIPPNPTELLESKKLHEFLEYLKTQFDYIIIDSPPVVAVADSEVLSKYVDAALLVVSANVTERDLMVRAAEIMQRGKHHFVGTVLNNFVYKSTYGSYYKYYYYYSRQSKTDTDSSV